MQHVTFGVTLKIHLCCNKTQFAYADFIYSLVTFYSFQVHDGVPKSIKHFNENCNKWEFTYCDLMPIRKFFLFLNNKFNSYGF